MQQSSMQMVDFSTSKIIRVQHCMLRKNGRVTHCDELSAIYRDAGYIYGFVEVDVQSIQRLEDDCSEDDCSVLSSS